jgi:peptidoglycan/LPS O-acetylase OafA/YrhL
LTNKLLYLRNATKQSLSISNILIERLIRIYPLLFIISIVSFIGSGPNKENILYTLALCQNMLPSAHQFLGYLWSIAVDFQLYSLWTVLSVSIMNLSENPFKFYNFKFCVCIFIISITYRTYYLGWIVDQELLLSLPFEEYFVTDWRMGFPIKIAAIQYLEYNSLFLRSPPFFLGCSIAFHPNSIISILFHPLALAFNSIIFCSSLSWCSLGVLHYTQKINHTSREYT